MKAPPPPPTEPWAAPYDPGQRPYLDRHGKPTKKRPWWGAEFRETDVRSPTGEPLFAWAKVRPGWWWRLMRLRLFAILMWLACSWWRRHDETMSPRTAWEVSGMVWRSPGPLVSPLPPPAESSSAVN